MNEVLHAKLGLVWTLHTVLLIINISNVVKLILG